MEKQITINLDEYNELLKLKELNKGAVVVSGEYFKLRGSLDFKVLTKTEVTDFFKEIINNYISKLECVQKERDKWFDKYIELTKMSVREFRRFKNEEAHDSLFSRHGNMIRIPD